MPVIKLPDGKSLNFSKVVNGLEIAEKVSSRLNVPLNIVEKVDKRDYIVNFDRIKNELNFSTNFLAEDGIEEMVKILEDGNFDLEQSNV